MPLSLALLSGAVPPARRPLAIGIWGGISGLGVAVGPLVGGAIMEGWDWQAIFWINVPVALIAIPLALLVLNNDFGARARIDVPGAVLAAAGVLALVHAIVRGNDDGWDSLGVIVEIVAGVAPASPRSSCGRLRAKAPLVPLRLFRDRSFSITNIVGFAFSFGTFGSVFILIQYLQVVQGSTPLEAAVQTTPWTLAPMFVAPIAGILAPRVGTRVLHGDGPRAAGCRARPGSRRSCRPTSTTRRSSSPFIMAGVGMGLVFAPSATALLATLGLIDHAKASGVNSTVRELGVALGTAVMTAIFVERRRRAAARPLRRRARGPPCSPAPRCCSPRPSRRCGSRPARRQTPPPPPPSECRARRVGARRVRARRTDGHRRPRARGHRALSPRAGPHRVLSPKPHAPRAADMCTRRERMIWSVAGRPADGIRAIRRPCRAASV